MLDINRPDSASCFAAQQGDIISPSIKPIIPFSSAQDAGQSMEYAPAARHEPV
jgi:hypothetical protein